MTKHAKNKQLKQIENQSQSGRSMVEMLGVLAIVAILSIGGIIMFRYAMNYYQADQIAHELNIMRTDAQIKIAQGTEKLAFGEPYDPLGESRLGHIQFNDDYPIDFACALADEEAIELSGISCHVANAYYIELQNIPEGVCRPLAELLNGLSDIIAFNVNKKEYPDKGNCEAGNENVLNAVFSAEAVLNLVFCETSTDCNELKNTPYCDNVRHVCVECVIHDDCGDHTQYCEENTCITCPNEKVWDGTDCVECTADSDCPTETPKCDGNTCKRCTEIDARTPVWNGEKCVECTENSHCAAGQGCLSNNTCGNCRENSQCTSNNCQSGICENCETSADCTENRSCENGMCHDSCVEHPSGCAGDTHCDSTTLKCEPDCQSSEECPELQVCNSISGVCEDDCTAEGAMNCKSGSHCDSEAQKCALNCQSSEECPDLQVCNSISGVCEDDCTAEGAMDCKSGSHCDSEAQKCLPNCKSSAECPDLKVCNSISGVCEEDCTAEGAMDCKNGSHCDTLDTHKCVKCITDSDCENPTPICGEEHTCVACKTSDECRLKNPLVENCVAGGACCDDPLMTWTGSECVCPADYVKSPTSSGKTVCLPYCKDEDNIGVILMTDTSSSMTSTQLENANKAKEALNIPEHINSAVYWCGKCYNGNCLSKTPSSALNRRLDYGKHSVDEIRSHLQTKSSDKITVASDFGGGIYDIISYCKNIKEKLFIIVWWDNVPSGIGNDLNSFGKLKTECPGVILYSVAPNAASFKYADKNFNLNNATPDYMEVLNKVLKERSCVEREEEQ